MKYDFSDPDINEFLLWETASKDTIDFKRIYVDVTANPADNTDRGDIIAGILLSQLIYWFLPSKDKKSRVGVKRNGKLWLAKERQAWWDEIRISAKQYDRASKLLVKRGLAETRVVKFSGNPTCAIRPNFTAIINAIKQRLGEKNQAAKPIGRKFLPKGKERYTAIGKNDISQKAISFTETISETINSPPLTCHKKEEDMVEMTKLLPPPFDGLSKSEINEALKLCNRHKLNIQEQCEALKPKAKDNPAHYLLQVLRNGGFAGAAELVAKARVAAKSGAIDRKRVEDALLLGDIPRWMRPAQPAA